MNTSALKFGASYKLTFHPPAGKPVSPQTRQTILEAMREKAEQEDKSAYFINDEETGDAFFVVDDRNREQAAREGFKAWDPSQAKKGWLSRLNPFNRHFPFTLGKGEGQDASTLKIIKWTTLNGHSDNGKLVFLAILFAQTARARPMDILVKPDGSYEVVKH